MRLGDRGAGTSTKYCARPRTEFARCCDQRPSRTPVARGLCPGGGPEPAAAFDEAVPCSTLRPPQPRPATPSHAPHSAHLGPRSGSNSFATVSLPACPAARSPPRSASPVTPSSAKSIASAWRRGGPRRRRRVPALHAPGGRGLAATPVPAPDVCASAEPRRRRSRPRTWRSTRRNAARSPNWRKANAAGRSAIRARRISPFAATKRSRASPIAPAMPAWPIASRHGGALSERSRPAISMPVSVTAARGHDGFAARLALHRRLLDVA